MQTLTLARTALPGLTFTGKLLVEDLGKDTKDASHGRFHNIAVYEADDGQLIVSVQYRSHTVGEMPDDFVEAVDDFDEVDAVLSLYDPTVRAQFTELDQRESQRRQSVIAALTSAFDRQVANVLQCLATVEYA